MLVLTRKVGQSLIIGDIEIVVTKLGKGRVTIGIKAEKKVPVVRGELRTKRNES